MVMLVAEVVEDVLELKLSGTAALPASPTSAVMAGYDPAAPAPTGLAVTLKPFSKVEPANVQVLLGAPVKPPGSPPVRHHL
jgi:hypothetical protein